MPELSDAAFLYAEVIDAVLRIEEPAELANGLLETIRSLLRIKNDEFAASLLPQTLTAIRELDDEKERNYLLRLFIELECEMGRIDDAVQTVRHIENDTDQKGVAHKAIAITQAQRGLFAEAHATTDEIEDLDDYEEVLEAVGKRQTVLKRYREVLETANKIENGRVRSRLLHTLALDQWTTGNAEAALATLRGALAVTKGIIDHDVRDQSLAATVLAFCELRRNIDAIAVAKEIGGAMERIKAFHAMVMFMKRDGNVAGSRSAMNEAVLAARNITDPCHRGCAMQELGKVLHEIGDREEAKDIFREALASFQEIRNIYSQTTYLTQLGVQLGKIGLSNVATRVFRLASGLAENIEGEPFQLTCLMKILEGQVEVGLNDEGIKTLALIDEMGEMTENELLPGSFDREMAYALSTLGYGFAVLPDDACQTQSRLFFDAAIKQARDISDPLNQSKALRYVAEKLSQREMSDNRRH